MKNYFSAQELDDLHLSSLPSCKRLINIRAKKKIGLSEQEKAKAEVKNITLTICLQMLKPRY